MSRNRRLASLAAAAFSTLAGPAFAETTLKALFMAQSAYSEADVRAMTDGFAKANPDVKVDLEFVPYEGLRDKTILAQGSGEGYDVVLFDVIWPAEYSANNILIDITDRVTTR
jgi:multiple sugar transport system substrate-binding protein